MSHRYLEFKEEYNNCKTNPLNVANYMRRTLRMDKELQELKNRLRALEANRKYTRSGIPGEYYY